MSDSIVLDVKKKGFRWLHVENRTGLTFARYGRPGTAYFLDNHGDEWFGFLGRDADQPGYRRLMVARNVPM